MKKSILIPLLVLTVITLCSCSNKSKPREDVSTEKSPTEENLNTENSDTEYKDLIEELEGKGFTTTYKEEVENNVLSVKAKRLTINENDNLFFYLYDTSDKMEEDSTYLSKSGSEYDNGKEDAKVKWSEHPHFFKGNKLIVLYLGDNLETINVLEELLGSQFVGYTN